MLRVRVKPRGPRDAVLGVTASGLAVVVRAAPEKGKANAAVLATLARWLGLPPSALSLLSGEASRAKRVLVRGRSAADLRRRLAELAPR